ncbi:PA0069 family radical SAM protein [Novosphingopyxis iocasae]|uniref:PA0069 family radical SAM protein n=1 Tax=Novosphingopyxis iocasae TaxID=2762729 RepID=UPI0016510D02|nr:PA0069 family radical SAM protein [Novosphingopyxis iocasae]
MGYVKGRGAIANDVSARYGLPEREIDGDWLDQVEALDGPSMAVSTAVTELRPKTIISYNQSPDIPFTQSINPFNGCEHGCVYCFARPSHAFHDLSPGLDFETKLFAKPQAAELLRATLAKPTYAVRPIAIGTNTDPYQPIERRYRISRAVLELMVETRHPICVTTKSDRVLDDLDLLVDLAQDGLTAVAISVTTLDPALARIMEPRAAHPSRRLKAVETLVAKGVPTYVNIAPIIPAITDHEIEAITQAAASAGAKGVSAIPLRLPHELAPLFRDWLDVYYPDRAARVMRIVGELRGGKDNDPAFFARMRGKGPWAELLRTRMDIARRRHGFVKGKFDLRCDLFRRPEINGQLRLI